MRLPLTWAPSHHTTRAQLKGREGGKKKAKKQCYAPVGLRSEE